MTHKAAAAYAEALWEALSLGNPISQSIDSGEHWFTGEQNSRKHRLWGTLVQWGALFVEEHHLGGSIDLGALCLYSHPV